MTVTSSQQQGKRKLKIIMLAAVISELIVNFEQFVMRFSFPLFIPVMNRVIVCVMYILYCRFILIVHIEFRK